MSTSQKIKCYQCIVQFENVETLSHAGMLLKNSIFQAPSGGIYLFTFHALADAGHPVKVQLMVNERPRAFIYDRDVSGSNNRFAMVSQTIMVPMEKGDQFYILLHEGALKGGGISHTFTSLNGHKIANKKAITDENNGLL